MNLYLQRLRGCGRTYSLRSEWVKLICVVFLGSVGLMIIQFLDDEALSRAEEKKPIIIDIRSDKPSGSVDEDLYVVDGVLRRFEQSTDMDKLFKDERHSISTLSKFKSMYHKFPYVNAESQGDSLRVNLLASMVGQETGDWFGLSVSGVDDFNGDGYDDLVVGGPSNWGDVYIFYGGEEVDTIPDVWIKGDYSFGWSVSGAGDVNRDGYGDVVVGEIFYGPPSQAGAAYIFFGGPLTSEYIVLAGDQEELNLGADVATLGDINKDGYDDVILGTDQNHGSGRAYIYFGGSVVDTIPDLILKGENYLDYFGHSVSSAGDVNSDGSPDIIIGTFQFRVEKAYIFLGGVLLDTIPDLIFTGPLDSDFGWYVASAGDVNGDGYDDVMVSAHWYTEDPGTTPPGYGRVYIYYGGAAMDTVPDVILSGTAEWTCFGGRFSTVGDLNFDGCGDIIVSAHCHYAGNAGKARIFLGGLAMSDIDTLADAVIEGENIEDDFSISLSGTHDVNRDGLNDVVIGAPFYDIAEYDEGKTYVYSVLPGLSIVTMRLSHGFAGFSYSETLSVYDGTPPYTWSLYSGSLPDGLEFNPNGVIHGITTTADTFIFAVQVTDAEQATDTQDLSIVICQGAKSDVNCDGTINIFDVVRVVNIILDLEPPPTEYELWAGDCNKDDTVNILDAVCIINLILGTNIGGQYKRK